MSAALRRDEIVLHGHRIRYVTGGQGPVILLVHGITSACDTWERVLPPLADRFTVLAPDLLGHGQSDKPAGDYSLGSYAAGIRDLLLALGHESATLVGHSLGGGIVMQLAYQFPERCERLVLVSSGGLGRSVHLMLRAATLPGSEYVLPLIAHPRLVEAGAAVARALGRLRLQPAADLGEAARGYASLGDAEARTAFLRTLRGIVDARGQLVSARDRLYLAEEVPTLLVWGERDPIIPARHGRRAHEEIPGSRLEVFEDAGHFPHVDDPYRFVQVLTSFVEQTTPNRFDARHWRELLLSA